MNIVIWLAQKVGEVWHILDFDLLGIGINLNMLLLGITLFGVFINFFRRLGGFESDGVGQYSRYVQRINKQKER